MSSKSGTGVDPASPAEDSSVSHREETQTAPRTLPSGELPSGELYLSRLPDPRPAAPEQPSLDHLSAEPGESPRPESPSHSGSRSGTPQANTIPETPGSGRFTVSIQNLAGTSRRQTNTSMSNISDGRPLEGTSLADELERAAGQETPSSTDEPRDDAWIPDGDGITDSPTAESGHNDSTARGRADDGGSNGDGAAEREGQPDDPHSGPRSRGSVVSNPLSVTRDDDDAGDDGHAIEGRGQRAGMRPPMGSGSRPAPPPRASNDTFAGGLERVWHQRGRMFEPLLARIREEGLEEDAQALSNAEWAAGADMPQYNPVDIEQYSAQYIERLYRTMAHPEQGLAPSPIWRNLVTSEMHAMASGMKSLMTESVMRFLEQDVAWVSSTMVEFSRLMRSPLPRPRSAGTAADFDPSGPEPVNTGTDRDELAELSKEQLMFQILHERQKREDDLDQMRQHLADYEVRIVDADMTITQAETRIRQVEAEKETSRRDAYDHGRAGYNIEGTELVSPRADQEKLGQVDSPSRGGDRVPREPASREAQGDLVSPLALPRLQGSDGFLEVSMRAPAVGGDAMRQDFADIQRVMTLLDDERMRSLQFVEETGEVALREAAERAAGSQAGSRGPSNRTSSSTSTDDLTREQLQARLRTMQEERDALRGERDEYIAQALARGNDISNLSPACRQQVIDLTERPFKLISNLIRHLTRCSQTTTRFAQTLVQVGRMDTRRQPVGMALRNVMGSGARVTSTEPPLFDQEPGPYGDLDWLQNFQHDWLPQIQAFFDRFVEHFSELETLRTRATQWKDANPQDEQGNFYEDLEEEDGQQQKKASGSGHSTLSRAASAISGIFWGGKGDKPDDSQHKPANEPLYTDPEWLLLHPDGLPCNSCAPVSADIFEGGPDLGPCMCGHGVDEPSQHTTTASCTSGASRVSFADENDRPAAASNLSSPRSILRRGPRRPLSLDAELANENNNGIDGSDDKATVASRPSTPHPSKTGFAAPGGAPVSPARQRGTDEDGNIVGTNGRPLAGSPRRIRDQGGEAAGVARATRAAPVPSCKCRCRVEGKQNILSAGNGPRFAYFTCTKMMRHSLSVSSEHSAPSEHSASQHEPRPSVHTPGDPGMPRDQSFTPPGSGGLYDVIRRTGSSRASRASHVSSQASRAPSRAPSRASPAPPSPASRVFLKASSSEHSTRDGPRSPGRSDEEDVGAANIVEGRTGDGPPGDEELRNEEAEEDHHEEPHDDPQPNELDGGNPAEHDPDAGQPPKRQSSSNRPPSRRASGGQPPQGQPPGGGQPGSGCGGGDGGGPDLRRPQAPGPAPARALDPRWQILVFIREVWRFLTYGQVYNILAILQFLVALLWHAVRVNMNRLMMRMGRRRQLPPWIPTLPAEEIVSFTLWLGIMWLLTTMVAVMEERRLWLAANPRTASYMRGLRHRNPYPWWSPFEVDYSFLEPSFGGLSVWLHQAYFRPGLDALLQVVEHPFTEAIGNATWLGWAGIPIALMM